MTDTERRWGASHAVRDERRSEVTPVLSTNLRTTRTLDPCIGGMPAVDVAPCQESVTAPEYRRSVGVLSASRPRITTPDTTVGTASFDAAWSFIGRKPMPKVALHPDRWPLHSTS